jgi:transposase
MREIRKKTPLSNFENMKLQKKLFHDKLTLIAMNALIQDYACEFSLSLEGSLSAQCTKAGVNRTQIHEKKMQIQRALEKIEFASPGRPAHQQHQVRFEERKKDKDCFVWMHSILQRKTGYKELEEQLSIDKKSLDILFDWVLNKPFKYRNRALVTLAYLNQFSPSAIARYLGVQLHTVCDYINRFESGGVDALLDRHKKKELKKYEQPKYKEAVFKILHAPPANYGINRTSWRLEDLCRILKQEGFPICRAFISRITKDAGYRYLKAKKVLTSKDPDYQEKLHEITRILSNLKPNEKFFSIDEYGPFAIKKKGGKSLVAPGEVKTFPQWQKSKGRLIITGGLELSTNQMTYFYSSKKNTVEMIKLLEILIDEYKDEECIYFSWDAASWHASQKLYKKVEEVNSWEYKQSHKIPIVKLAPLPAGSQFLNVIESVFSGMARAIIHNSDYASVEESMKAVDRYFLERNRYFQQNPKRAGKKIWGKEVTKPEFNESNNCKDPRYR